MGVQQMEPKPPQKQPATLYQDISYSALIDFIHEQLEQYQPADPVRNPGKLIDKYLKEPTVQNDRTVGCVFGSITGDVLGAYCEFENHTLSSQKLSTSKSAMQMQGGGVFGLSAGQFTDDSELTYHLLKGLSSMNLKQSLYLQVTNLLVSVGRQYVKWYNSQPFDMGITTRNGISIIERSLERHGDTLNDGDFKDMLRDIWATNKNSQSNGSLMRITPLAVLVAQSGASVDACRELIRNQIALIHANSTLQAAGLIWVQVLVDLIRRKDNLPNTFRQIFERAEQSNKSDKNIKEWFIQAKEEKIMIATKNIGWAKIAWSYGMNLLYRLGQGAIKFNDLDYREVIKEVIVKAGDTDTNAAIVGGMLGSIIGFTKIPTAYMQTMLNLRMKNAKGRTRRPPQYQPFNVLLVTLDLISKCEELRLKNIEQKQPQLKEITGQLLLKRKSSKTEELV